MKKQEEKQSAIREEYRDLMRGVKLKDILIHLVENIGWEGLAEQINIKCFKIRPTLKSSLPFIRRTPWVIERMEKIYVDLILKEQDESQ